MAGMAIAWSAEALRADPLSAPTRKHLVLMCAGLAIAPDLDFVYPPIHRTFSHSISAVFVVGLLAALYTRRTRPEAIPAVGLLLYGLAYASHLGLDWIGGDTKLPAGIQLLWPFSDAWFISPVRVFRPTDLGAFFMPYTMLSNALVVVREVLILSPVLAGAWFLRARRGSAAPRDHRLGAERFPDS